MTEGWFTNSRVAKNTPCPVASVRPTMPPWLSGLPVTHAGAFRSEEPARIDSCPVVSAAADRCVLCVTLTEQSLVLVLHPRHLALAGAYIGGGHIHGGADEAMPVLCDSASHRL